MFKSKFMSLLMISYNFAQLFDICHFYFNMATFA